MKSLFPEIDQEVRDDRKAKRREEVQRARDRLRGRDLSWIINYLLENGPTSEHKAMIDALDGGDGNKLNTGLDVLMNLYDLWMVRKLWRKPLGIHPGSGEEYFLYGIRGVHERPSD